MAEEFKPEQKTEEDEKWLSRRVDGDVDLEDVDDLSSWIRTKMKERNEQIEQEDEETKKAKLAERKRKVLSYQEQQKILLKELADMKKKCVGEGDFCYYYARLCPVGLTSSRTICRKKGEFTSSRTIFFSVYVQ